MSELEQTLIGDSAAAPPAQILTLWSMAASLWRLQLVILKIYSALPTERSLYAVWNK